MHSSFWSNKPTVCFDKDSLSHILFIERSKTLENSTPVEISIKNKNSRLISTLYTDLKNQSKRNEQFQSLFYQWVGIFSQTHRNFHPKYFSDFFKFHFELLSYFSNMNTDVNSHVNNELNLIHQLTRNLIFSSLFTYLICFDRCAKAQYLDSKWVEIHFFFI